MAKYLTLPYGVRSHAWRRRDAFSAPPRRHLRGVKHMTSRREGDRGTKKDSKQANQNRKKAGKQYYLDQFCITRFYVSFSNKKLQTIT